jgi:trimethylamine--corrinoid protein Co-methyltransferase
MLVNSAKTEIIRSWGIPVYGTGGCTDSKLIDGQAAMECQSSCFFEFLSRTNMVHDCGFIESGMTSSYEMITLADEIISMARRFCAGINLKEENIALDVIEQVGPDGTFIERMHTFQHFRNEQWSPSLISREGFKDWKENGGSDLTQRLNRKVKDILESHTPTPLSTDKKSKILSLVGRRFQKKV